MNCFNFLEFYLHRCLERIAGSFIFAADYFNQSVFGWEPLVEDWHLKQLSMAIKNNAVTVDVFADERSTFNINITQAFLRQAMHLSSQLSEIKQAFDDDFRGTCMRSRSDHLPYILHNETGSDLRFTTEVNDVIEARKMQRKSTAKWYLTAAGTTTTFEFPTKRLAIIDSSEEMRQLIVRVDGWDEISPVNVDAVGTYFRLAMHSASRSVSSLYISGKYAFDYVSCSHYVSRYK
ncbi:unnamed protein product [Gongylonema pulchrum]|uniref:Uncharacterized protein n=1 Tax=Gongylonema pulchrum TaxID=637853 RepID=A0A3P6QKZ9_9BILA|nr:unnamed protein product [Gongylonema pulchrum]